MAKKIEKIKTLAVVLFLLLLVSSTYIVLGYHEALWSFIPIVATIAGTILIKLFKKGSPEFIRKRQELERQFEGQTVFLCTRAEDLGEDLYQFYGYSKGQPIRPNMTIELLGRSFPIYEVYADDEKPSQPDSEIKEGMIDVALVVKSASLNLASFDKTIKENQGIIALKVD